MDRGVRVNAKYLAGYSEDAVEDLSEGGSLSPPVSAASGADYGPCLYLGPSGQRCSRRALEGGFCAVQRPGAKRPEAKPSHTKRLAAVIAALTALLPWLIDVLREFFRHLR